MRQNKTQLIYLFVVSSMLVLGCSMRYNNIPRVSNFGSKSNSFQTGHYVKAQNHIADTINTLENYLHKLDASPPFETAPSKKFATSNTPPVVDKITSGYTDTTQQSDTTKHYDIDKSLIRGSGTMFAIATGLNAALLITPVYNFLFIGLLLGLALLVIGYFVSKFVENARETRTRPVKLRAKNYSKAGQVKKAFNTLMIISASSFSLALITAATGSFDLPIFFFIVGMIALWGGLLVGLVYLVLSV